MKNKALLNNKWLITCATILVSSIGAIAEEVTSMKQALELALADKTIAAEGDKVKLYSASANITKERINFTFRFYTGGENIHAVSVNKSGKTRYYASAKGSSRVFDDLDFTKLPAPSEVIVEGAVEQCKKALTDLGFAVLDNGKYSTYYSISSEFREKSKH